MGLDQYAYTCKPEYIGDKQVDFEDDIPRNEEGDRLHTELAYWRKHPDLEGWMSDLYYRKGGAGNDGMFGNVFNCNTLRLTEEDLDDLEEAVRNDELPHTEGFFFGESQPEDKEYTLMFVENARVALLEGMAVYYTSWW